MLLAGCGREGPLITPERASPQAPEVHEVKGTTEGVSFAWIAPEKDRRGKPLKELYGYTVYRRELHGNLDIAEDEDDFSSIGAVDDNTIATLQARKDRARETGKILRKVKLSEQERTVSLVDTDVVKGHLYIYKIVPKNHPLVDGASSKYAKVMFDGESSQVSLQDGPKDREIFDGELDTESEQEKEDKRFQAGS